MSNVALAKPKTISSAVITCTKFGTAGTDFHIKVGRARIKFRNKYVENTGDGDTAPAFDAANWQYTSVAIAGWMVAGSVSTFLLASLWDGTTPKNPLQASFKLSLASSQVLTIPTALITDWEIDWQRDGELIPMFCNILATDTVATWGIT